MSLSIKCCTWLDRPPRLGCSRASACKQQFTGLILPVELDHPALLDAPDIAAVAHGDITVITAQHHLSALGNDKAVANTGIDGGFGAAIAHSFDLLNAVSQLHEPLATGKEPGQKIGTQAKTQHRDVEIIHDLPQPFDLPGGQELTFVHNDNVAVIRPGILKQGVDIRIRGGDLGIGLQADAAANRGYPIPGVGAGL